MPRSYALARDVPMLYHTTSYALPPGVYLLKYNANRLNIGQHGEGISDIFGIS